MASLPFLTLPDPATAGEGKLDPLGLSTTGERLADRILPGLRERMSRPRFVTAMAVCSQVCEGLDVELANETETPAYLVFEWLLVEAFVRCAEQKSFRGTPGTQKAQAVRDSHEVMCARTYLRVPTIFGFNGVHKPLARNLGIVSEVQDSFSLGDRGYELLKIWQDEQGLTGFLESSVSAGPGTAFRAQLRTAVKEGLENGFTKRAAHWQGWSLLAKHLVPSGLGRREADFLYRMLLNEEYSMRGEVFRLLRAVRGKKEEALVIERDIVPKASKYLNEHLRAIISYEQLCTLLEDAFDWIRHLSSMAGAKAITAKDYTANASVRQIVRSLPKAIDKAEKALEREDLALQTLFSTLARSFDKVKAPEDLFEAILSHHSVIQKAKLPDGKRDWFERESGGATFVRVPYQQRDPIEPRDGWSRPYRINTARDFLVDLGKAS